MCLQSIIPNVLKCHMDLTTLSESLRTMTTLLALQKKKKNLPASITYIQITAETRKSLLKKFITVNPLFMLPTFFFPFTVFKV